MVRKFSIKLRNKFPKVARMGDMMGFHKHQFATNTMPVLVLPV